MTDEKDKADEDGAANSNEDDKAEEGKAEETKAEETKSAGEILSGGDPAAAMRDEKKPKDEKPEDEKPDEPKADEPKADEAPAPTAVAASEPVAAAPAPVLVPVGTLVEFETEESLMAACEKVRDAGWSRWDAHTPYPVHGLDAAMGIKSTILPWIVFFGGLTGCMVGLGLQFYTNGIELPFSLAGTLVDPFLPSGYPYVASGKPIFSVPANIPVTFELTILLSAFGAFFGVWGLNKLPQFWHPVFTSTRFRRATSDRFFISFETEDPMFDPKRTRAFAETLGGIFVEDLMGEEEEA